MIYNWFLNSQKWWEEMCVVHKSWFRPIKRYYQTNCPGAIIVLMLIIYMAKTNFWKWEIRETKQDPTRSSSPATNEKLLPNKLPGGHSHEQTRKNWFAFCWYTQKGMLKSYMSDSRMIQKVEYGWGPIFKVVLEC